MTRWFRRMLLVVLAVLALPLLAVAGALAWANTEGGRASLARLVANQVPGLSIEDLRGPLPGQPGVARLTMADAEGVWLTVEKARIDLDFLALAQGVFRIRAIEAWRIALTRLPLPAAPAPPASPTGTVLPQLPSLPVAVALDRLSVGRLELGGPVLGQAAVFTVQGDAGLAAGALHATLDLRRLDAEAMVGLRLALTPATDRLAARLMLREAAGGLLPTLLGQAGQPAAVEFSLDGPAGGAALDLRAALGPDLTMAATGTVRAAPGGAVGATLRGEARAAPLLPPDLAKLAVPASFSLDADLAADRRLTLRALTLGVPAGRLTASGAANLATEALDLRLALDLAAADRFAPLLPAGLGWQGVRATALVTGTIARPEVSLEAMPDGLATGVAQANALLGPAPRLTLRAALPGPTLDARLEGAAASLTAQGSLAEPVAVEARLSLPRLAVLGAGSEGALDATVRASGALSDPTIEIAARSDRIEAAGQVLQGLRFTARVAAPASAPRAEAQAEGTLADLPMTLLLRGRPEGTKLRIEEAAARLGPARLILAGLLDPAGPLFDGTARLEATDLAPLARLGGVADLAGRLDLQAKLAPAPGGIQGFEMRLDAPRLAYGGTTGTLAATAAGTPAAIDWTIQGRATEGQGRTPEGAVSGRGRVAQAAGGWRLDLAALEAQGLGEQLRLAAPAQVVLGADGGIVVPGLGLALGRGGRLQAAGRWGPETADLNVTLAGLPLALAQRFAPEVQPQGTLAAEIRATGPVARPMVRATLQGSGLRAGEAWGANLPVLALQAEATLAGEALQAQATLDAGAAGRLAATARFPTGFGPQAPLAASVDGTLNLAPLASPFLAAGADRVAGRLAVALRAEGAVGAPRLGGRATLSGGDYRNALYGIRISDLAGSVQGDGSRLVIEQFQGRTAGGGTIGLQGSVDTGAAGLPADLTLTLRNARPLVSDLVTATLGGDLRLTGPLLGAGTLAGEVRVQQADIRVPERLPASVPTLTNVRQRGRAPPGSIPPPPPVPPAAPGAGAPPLGLAVKVTAQRVFIRGRGLDAEMAGDVTVGGTLAAPVPSGQLTLRRGTLSVLARRLTFQRGTIGFTTGTLVPQLDLAAQATAGQTTITVAVRGSPAAPDITFSSTPELPQDEILARLLFDRATSNLSPFEIAQLAEALAQLTGIGGGSGALDRVRSALGLDRLGVAGNATGSGAALEAGRYVAPGVYLGVRQGTQGQTGVGVQVEITPRLKLEGQTATGPAGDRLGLSYELEY